jgi:hypothetical protein
MRWGFFILLLACCLRGAWLDGVVAGKLATTRYLDYRGDLGGTIVIGLSLEDSQDRQQLRGVYFYKKYLKDIPLEGEYTGERSMVLRERGANGVVSGIFALRFADRDPRGSSGDTQLNKEVLVGEWTSADSTTQYPIYLRLRGTIYLSPGQSRYAVAGARDDALIEHNAKAFYRSVLAGNRRSAARYVAYPVSFFLHGKRRTAASETEFLKSYRAIFTKDFVDRIARDMPHHMFANAEGIMLADGAVWFDEQGKVRQLNNAPP